MREVLADLGRRLKRDRVSMAAGSLAYHWFLALFPAVIAALGLLSVVHVGASTLHHLTSGIARALPPGSAGVFDAAVRAATKRASGSLSAVVIGIVIAVYSSSSGMAVLEQAMDVAYEVPDDRKFVARRLRALPLMALTAVLGGVGAALIVFGAPIGGAIGGQLPIAGSLFTAAWDAARWIVALLLIALLFSAYYYLAPNRQNPRWRWVTPGSVLATAVFLVASLGFSFYVSAFGSYGRTYGSFAGVAILIFWLYLIGIAVLIGAELNAATERRAAARTGVGDPAATTAGGAPAAAVAERRAAS